MQIKSWVIKGLIWGLLMFVALQVVFPLVEGEAFTVKKLLFGFVLWMVFGLLFGKTTEKFSTKSKEKSN